MNRTTEFSPCRKYRYTLWREWDCDSLTGCADDLKNAGSYLMVIGLNPSTADETQDDPTIRRCIGFAKAWGFGALCMTNLFAWRDTDPEDMKLSPDPIGPGNDKWLNECATRAGLIIAAWGKHGSYLYRGAKVKSSMRDAGISLSCLKINGDGTPKHPLYISADTKPIPYT